MKVAFDPFSVFKLPSFKPPSVAEGYYEPGHPSILRSASKELVDRAGDLVNVAETSKQQAAELTRIAGEVHSEKSNLIQRALESTPFSSSSSVSRGAVEITSQAPLPSSMVMIDVQPADIFEPYQANIITEASSVLFSSSVQPAPALDVVTSIAAASEAASAVATPLAEAVKSSSLVGFSLPSFFGQPAPTASPIVAPPPSAPPPPTVTNVQEGVAGGEEGFHWPHFYLPENSLQPLTSTFSSLVSGGGIKGDHGGEGGGGGDATDVFAVSSPSTPLRDWQKLEGMSAGLQKAMEEQQMRMVASGGGDKGAAASSALGGVTEALRQAGGGGGAAMNLAQTAPGPAALSAATTQLRQAAMALEATPTLAASGASPASARLAEVSAGLLQTQGSSMSSSVTAARLLDVSSGFLNHASASGAMNGSTFPSAGSQLSSATAQLKAQAAAMFPSPLPVIDNSWSSSSASEALSQVQSGLHQSWSTSGIHNGTAFSIGGHSAGGNGFPLHDAVRNLSNAHQGFLQQGAAGLVPRTLPLGEVSAISGRLQTSTEALVKAFSATAKAPSAMSSGGAANDLGSLATSMRKGLPSSLPGGSAAHARVLGDSTSVLGQAADAGLANGVSNPVATDFAASRLSGIQATLGEVLSSHPQAPPSLAATSKILSDVVQTLSEQTPLPGATVGGAAGLAAGQKLSILSASTLKTAAAAAAAVAATTVTGGTSSVMVDASAKLRSVTGLMKFSEQSGAAVNEVTAGGRLPDSAAALAALNSSLVQASSVPLGVKAADVAEDSNTMEALNTALSQALEGARSRGDPAEAAEKLRSFVLQYGERYTSVGSSGSTNVSSKVQAMAAKLQAFVDAHRPSSVEVQQDPVVVVSQASEVVQPPRNVLMEGVDNTLHWIQNLVGLPSSEALMAGHSQEEQLVAAAERLKALSEQMARVQHSYHIIDPEERAALSMVLKQMSSIADRLSGVSRLGTVGATSSPSSMPATATTAAATTALAVGPTPVATPSGVDPLLGLMDGLYSAVVDDSGLRDFLVGIKRLGDSVVGGMKGAWTIVPPAAHLVAYAASLAGALFLLRSRVPQILLQDTREKGSDVLPAAPDISMSMLLPTPSSSSLSPGGLLPASPTIIRGMSDGLTPGAATGDASYAWQQQQRQQQLVAHSDRSSPAGGFPRDGASGNNVTQTVWQQALRRGMVDSSVSPSPGGAAAAAQSKGGQHSAAGGSVATMAAMTAAAAVAAAVNLETWHEQSQMASEEQLRYELKRGVQLATLSLGPVMSVVPGGEPVRAEVDRLLSELEQLSPASKPLTVPSGKKGATQLLSPSQGPQLLGDWTLTYASNGGGESETIPADGTRHNLLAQLLQLSDAIPGLGMEAITQKLSSDAQRPGFISMENSAVFSFGPLGSWRLSVAGAWKDDGGGICALSSFQSFSIKPVSFLGLPIEGMPEVTVPIPEPLQSQSAWCTTYLDHDTRIGRGANGAVFLFKRPSQRSAPSSPAANQSRVPKPQLSLASQTSTAYPSPYSASSSPIPAVVPIRFFSSSSPSSERPPGAIGASQWARKS